MIKIKLLLIAIFLNSCIAGIPNAKFSITVVDQNGKNVPNAIVRAEPRKIISKPTDIEKITDGTKPVTYRVYSVLEWVNCYVNKENHYQSSLAVGYGEFKKNKILNRWEPWGKNHTITLKEKLNPVPMYAQNTESMQFPELNKAIGYDLEKGDWVKPHGKGIISDFIFNFKYFHDTKSKTRLKPWAVSFNLTFQNKLDGIQEYVLKDEDIKSEFIWPYKAPINGYQTSLYKHSSYNMNGKYKRETNIKENRNQGAKKSDQAYYIFRVRTKVDAEGNIISANYGKIQGDFRLGKKIKFTYYFNPSKDNGLEFDTTKNLFEWPSSGSKNRSYRSDRIMNLKP